MAVTELATGCHDSGSAALAQGGGEMLVLEYLLEFFHTGGRRSFEFGPGIFVERDEINLGPKTSQYLGQLSSCLL